MGKILVVDDQLGIRHLLGEILRDGHEVKTTEDGAKALKLLIAFQPDLILLDMKMPVMNGLETLERIRALGCRVDVIMMSASGDNLNIEQAKDLGILYFMGKPFDLFELRERVRKIINSSERMAEQLTS